MNRTDDEIILPIYDGESNKKINRKLETINPPPPNRTHYLILDGRRIQDYTRLERSPAIDETQIVLQSTYSIAGGTTNKRYIESAWAGPCVIVSLYDPASKTASMMHLDSRSTVMYAIREAVKRCFDNSSYLQMRIIGGYIHEESSKRIVQELRQIATLKKIQIVEEDVLDDDSSRKDVSVVLDTETGYLYDLPNDSAQRFTPEQRLQLAEKIDQIQKTPSVQMGGIEFIENVLD